MEPCDSGNTVPFLGSTAWPAGSPPASLPSHPEHGANCPPVCCFPLLPGCRVLPDRARCRLILCPHLRWQGLTNHVLAHMCHGVKLLLTDLTGELLLRVAMHYLVVLVQGPELLEGFATCHALKGNSFSCDPEPALASLVPQFPHLKCAGKKAGSNAPSLRSPGKRLWQLCWLVHQPFGSCQCWLHRLQRALGLPQAVEGGWTEGGTPDLLSCSSHQKPQRLEAGVWAERRKGFSPWSCLRCSRNS